MNAYPEKQLTVAPPADEAGGAIRVTASATAHPALNAAVCAVMEGPKQYSCEGGKLACALVEPQYNEKQGSLSKQMLLAALLCLCCVLPAPTGTGGRGPGVLQAGNSGLVAHRVS